jgi:hypothetical protein
LTLFTLQASAQEQDPIGLERFKALLSGPPRIERMIYSQTLPPSARKEPFLQTGLAGSANRAYFEVRWQPNAMLHRQLSSPAQANDDTITGQCFSLWNGQFYFLDANTKPALYVFEEEKANQGTYSGPFHAAHIRMTEAAEPLNLGISHISPGSVLWEGSSFSLVTMADKKPNWIRGDITGFTNGVPNELRVQYSNDMGSARYRIAYDYADYRAPYYPSRIRAHFVRDGKEIVYSEFNILSLAVADQTLSEAHFNLSSVMLADGRSLLYLTNDTLYGRSRSGELVEAPAGVAFLRLSRREYYRNRYYYLAAMTWTFGLLLLGLTRWQKRKDLMSCQDNPR